MRFSDYSLRVTPLSMLLSQAVVVLFMFKGLFEFPEQILGVTVSVFYSHLNLGLTFFVFLVSVASRRIFLRPLIIVFLFFAFYGVCTGLIFHSFTEKTLANIYFYLMPALMLNFGTLVYKQHGTNFRHFFIAYAIKIWPFLIALSALYLFLWSVGLWGYYGFVSNALIASMFSHPGSLRFSLGFLLEVLSGKRTVIIVAALVLISRLNKKSVLFFLVCCFFLVAFLGQQIPGRLAYTFHFEWSDPRSLYLATGGRSSEISAIVNALKADPWKFLTGFGFGATYTSYDAFNSENFDVRHYSHFGPISYLFITGITSTILIYAFLSKFVLETWRHNDRFFLLPLVFYISSFFGAGLHVEPLPWLVFGYAMEMVKKE